MMTMTDNDNETICTSELLDLIQADIIGTTGTGTATRSSSGGSGARNSGILNQRQHDPFSVRLTRRQAVPSSHSPTASSVSSVDDDDDCDSNEENDNFEAHRPLARSSWMHSSGGAAGGRSKNTNRNNTNKRASSSLMSQQRMPFGGGYGGMFQDSSLGSRSTVSSHRHGSDDGQEETTTAGGGTNRRSAGSVDDNSSSAMSSILSFTSNLFSSKKQQGQQRYHSKDSTNPYSSASSINSCATGVGAASQYSSSGWKNYPILRNAPLALLQMPFRLRYFMQLFALIAIFMLASLNYFIAMEMHPTSNTNPHGTMMRMGETQQKDGGLRPYRMPDYEVEEEEPILEGGGASPNHIPRLRVHNPWKFLHRKEGGSQQQHHPHANYVLFDRAVNKFKNSVRFGHQGGIGSGGSSSSSGGAGIDADDEYSSSSSASSLGPFQYGWKSMPRLITTNFATGLSDDEIITNQHASNAEYYESMMGRIKKQLHLGSKVDLMGGGENEEEEEERSLPAKGTVAYVLPVTSCFPSTYNEESSSSLYTTNQPKDGASFRDFAIMLRAMIHAQSYRNSASGSVYDYKMHAMLHPHAKKCRDANDLFTVRTMNDRDENAAEEGTTTTGNWKNGVVDRSVVLQDLGYQVSIQYPPIDPSDIQGSDYLRTYLSTNTDEMNDLIRLYAYELEEYDAVVLVDYDTLILRPIDEVIDLIMESGVENQDDVVDQGDRTNDGGIDAVFSWEHIPSLVNSNARASVINLSFFALRPSKLTFAQLVRSYLTSAFSEGRGWGSIGRGSFPGWMTTQGFLTYYYDEVANAAKVEVNRCSFGNSGEEGNVNNSILITNEGKVDCFGGSDGQCKDCSKSNVEDVVVADLSYCRAPWECGDSGMEDSNGMTAENEHDEASSSTSDKVLSSGLCRQYQKMWFSGRLQMEDVHPQLQKGDGRLCIDGRYQPMMLFKPTEG